MKKKIINSAIYYVDLNSYGFYPKLKIHTLQKEELTYPSASIFSPIEFQSMVDNERKKQEEKLEAKRIYTIDNSYFIDSTLFSEFPFKFKTIYGTTNSGYAHKSLSKYTSDYNGEYLSSGHKILIADKKKMHGNYYYVGLLNSKCFYILEKNVSISNEEQNKLDTLLSCDTITRNRFFNFSKYNHSRTESHYAIERLSELTGHIKYGLSISDWGVYDESEYTDGTGISFDFFNPTKKIIKYITINFIGYNAVDDPVISHNGKFIKRKCIGPIYPGENATYSFDYVWFTDIVDYAKIQSIIVQYKDGTSKKITNPNKITWSDELTQFLNNSTLDDFEDIKLISNE